MYMKFTEMISTKTDANEPNINHKTVMTIKTNNVIVQNFIHNFRQQLLYFYVSYT